MIAAQNGTTVGGGSGARAPVSRSIRSIATRLPSGPISPIGPTHDGHPRSHAQLAIRSRVASSSRACISWSGALKPMPPG